ALEVACRARLLEDAGPDGYRFTHDVIRATVEGDLGTARRSMLHQRVAEVLEQGAGDLPVELLAYHYSRSDAPDKAVLYLELAGDKAQAQYANTAAAGYFREAVNRLERPGRTLDA